jgi:hypothetical protein
MTRSRVVEDSTGRGVLRTADGAEAVATEYRFVIEIEQHKAGREWIDGLPEIEARVSPSQAFALRAVLKSLPLVLELEDGRQFDCWMSGDGLLVARTGHALREPAESRSGPSPLPRVG